MAKPFADPALLKPQTYASFIADLIECALVKLQSAAPPTLGMFCVRKASGKQRLILDTRIVNASFVDPWHSELPTAGAWSALETNGLQQLAVCQADINNGFHRIGCLPKMEGLFKLFLVKIKLQA